jgi:hypothetical protein
LPCATSQNGQRRVQICPRQMCLITILKLCQAYTQKCAQVLIMSIRSVLPWSTCGNDWNTENCYLQDDNKSSSPKLLLNDRSRGRRGRDRMVVPRRPCV